MNKTERLLQMLEHPHDYTADEWQQILQDEECRDLYTLMAKTRGALDAARADEQLTDEQIEAEWQQSFEMENGEWKMENSTERPHSQFSILNFPFERIAAIFIGAIMLSGIALAAIRLWNLGPTQKVEEIGTPLVEDTIASTTTPLPADDETRAEVLVFDNVSLDSIAKAIAAYHHLPMEIENDEARQLRFFFEWNQKDSLQEVVEKLNMFEHVTMAVENGKLMVR